MGVPFSVGQPDLTMNVMGLRFRNTETGEILCPSRYFVSYGISSLAVYGLYLYDENDRKMKVWIDYPNNPRQWTWCNNGKPPETDYDFAAIDFPEGDNLTSKHLTLVPLAHMEPLDRPE